MLFKSRYKFFFTSMLIVLNGLMFSSCSTSKKTASTKPHYMSEDEEVVLKSTYYEATTKKILGEYDAALSLYRQCIALDPENAAANYEMADILEYEKQPDSALFFIQKAVQLDPQNIWYQELYAQCLQEKGRNKDVEGIYRNLIALHPMVSDYYYKLAITQVQEGNLSQAAATYEEAEKKLGFNDQVALNEVELYERAKDYPNAERKIQELIGRSPTSPEYYDMLGNLYDLEGKTDKAFEVYQKMEKQSPDDPMVHLSLADYYRDKKDDKKAFDELELAFAQSSLDNDTKIRILLTNFYELSRGNDTIAIQGMTLCRDAIKADPKDSKLHAFYGDFLFRGRNILSARNEYRASVGLDSSKYPVWYKLLVSDEQLGDFAAQANESKLAMGLFPTNPFPYLMNGEANRELKKYDDAVSSLQQGIGYALDTVTLVSFYSSMGDDNYYSKHYHESDLDYEAVLKLDPNNDVVLNNYSYYLSLRDTNLERAAAMSKKSNDLKPDYATYEDTYAWILYMQGKFQDAKEWEDKAFEHGGNGHSDILDHYGDIMFKLGNKDSALEYWQKAKEAGLQNDLIERKIKDKQLYEK